MGRDLDIILLAFPVRFSQVEMMLKCSGDGTGGRPLRVLVVDDEPDVEAMMGQMLRRKVRRGLYSLSFASNGREALERFQACRGEGIDVLVTDINMPCMTGLELLEALQHEHYDTKSIVVSAYGDMPNIRRAMNLGAFDFVTKPIDFEDLEAVIERTEQYLRRSWRALPDSPRADAEFARLVHSAVVPRRLPDHPGFELDTRVAAPSGVFAGGFSDVLRLEGGRLGLTVASVSGAGPAAALFLLNARSVLRGTAIGIGDPGEVFAKTNAIVFEDRPGEAFLEGVYVVHDPHQGTVACVRCGAPGAFVLGADGACRSVCAVSGPPIARSAEARYVESEDVLMLGETLVLVSTGAGATLDRPGVDALQAGLGALFSVHPPRGAGDAVERVSGHLREVLADDHDFACIALHRRPGGVRGLGSRPRSR